MASATQISAHPKRNKPLPEAFPTLVPSAAATRGTGFAAAARMRLRHAMMLAVFILMVPGPVGVATWYMLTRAQPQFAATFGFVIHSEGDGASGGFLSALPAIGSLSGSSSKDTDVLARFLQSQTVVADLNHSLNLEEAWSAHHAQDPVFALKPDGTIEDLARFWRRMVRVHYDYSAGLMEVEVRSFAPQHALTIADALERAASDLVNRLSGIAREDRLKHATAELDRAEADLVNAREALTTFRARHQMIDPMTDLEGDMQVIAGLQQQLTEERIARDVLFQTLAEAKSAKRREDSGDFRIRQSDRRIAIIENRIAEEKQKINGTDGRRNYAKLMGDFERLTVGVEIAQQGFVTALAAREAARIEADRQSRYVATYATAGLPERALYPRSWQIITLVAVGAFLIWSILMLVIYGLRDRQ
ncbi:sugar transporter [Pseudooceanicola onchidii]|uniref:sugar transporter n=1 Tax=Pseudooceanicola onchidii TaxID=2562279 RepID=UPI0010A9CE0F|nr:sugar transporter [Pseudooceanicola onchidii]